MQCFLFGGSFALGWGRGGGFDSLLGLRGFKRII
jgi:hypothetical protein